MRMRRPRLDRRAVDRRLADLERLSPSPVAAATRRTEPAAD
jgi:hypothetical protein